MKNVLKHGPVVVAVLVNTLLLIELSKDLYQTTLKPHLRKWKMDRAKKQDEELETDTISNDV